MEVYSGKVRFNDTSTNPGKGTKRFFGQIEMVDAEGDINSYAMISFRSQVISQSENLGKNGMSGKTVKVKGVFEQNTYNGNTNWQIKIEELYIDGMENLAETIKADATIQLPKKPSDITIPTNPTLPLVENIPQNSIQNYGVMPMPGGGPSVGGPGAVTGGFVYNQSAAVVNSMPSAGGPSAVSGGFIYNQTPQNTNNGLPSAPLNPQALPDGLSAAPGFVYNQTNQPTTKVEKQAKELSKFNNFELPAAY